VAVIAPVRRHPVTPAAPLPPFKKMARQKAPAPAHPVAPCPLHPQGAALKEAVKACHEQKQLAKMAGSGSIGIVS
jgi:hypothetical protein